MQYRNLGSTGERVSIIGIGGYHLAAPGVDEDIALRIIRTALDAGVNFLDNCWDYNEGESELRMGKALRDGYRERAFLMTKLDGRTAAAAARQLDESLARLQTDRIDLVQVHEVIRMEDAEHVFAPDGAIEALLEAKRAGKLRFIGFTGHKSPRVHLHMLDVAAAHGFRYDAVQLPVNVMDAHYDSFARYVLPVLTDQGIGKLGMKPMGDAVILRSMVVDPAECLRFALSANVDTVITGCDSLERLDQALEAANSFAPLSPDERREILDRTKPFAVEGKYELYKTATGHDGTVRHPEWLR